MNCHSFKILEKSFYKKDYSANLLDGLLDTLKEKVCTEKAESYFKTCGVLLEFFHLAYEKMKKNGADENSYFLTTFKLYPRTNTQDAIIAVKFRGVNYHQHGVVEELPEVCFHITENNFQQTDKEIETSNG